MRTCNICTCFPIKRHTYMEGNFDFMIIIYFDQVNKNVLSAIHVLTFSFKFEKTTTLLMNQVRNIYTIQILQDSIPYHLIIFIRNVLIQRTLFRANQFYLQVRLREIDKSLNLSNAWISHMHMESPVILYVNSINAVNL